ncbi:aspartyl-phosphate phosphatase Spo0E family protein [Neobacillus sp. PS3-40]|uniref:aspartyl-phosphate phosphatase Spo0E family protein n=1 Tax=Neobacillus sp. PS3-40 TaxID=3070679 RepID=UPI0027E0AD5A|nr:aspartyl-phosphate phosphatase Spo0E family protein [Neobacillus sp. PS3-40]WML44442.1 aspartyl-phosphate phosphatase Spo0E family protein [Neobacillus sp. PS3-40]
MATTNYAPYELQNKIEQLRKEMIMLGLSNGLGCPKTISVSQILDQYIAKYQACKKR